MGVPTKELLMNDEECELIAFEKALDYAELARFATVLFFSDSLN